MGRKRLSAAHHKAARAARTKRNEAERFQVFGAGNRASSFHREGHDREGEAGHTNRLAFNLGDGCRLRLPAPHDL